VFLENVGIRGEPVNVYGTAEVLQVLQCDVFNDRLFPDFIRISREGKPFLTLHTLTLGVPVAAAGLRFTPIAVEHVVPTVAYVVEDDSAAIAYITDTGPTTAIWERLRQTANFKAIFLEATFPQSQSWLADVSKHLTTATFARELAKGPPGVPVYAIHLKARFRAEIVAELAKLPWVSVCEPGCVYEF
jgi:cAMP phosphodiesterase